MTALSWRPGLADTCVASALPGEVNAYDTLAAHGYPNRHWLVGVQSESSMASSCTGVDAQSLPINCGGALTLAFEPYLGQSAARLRTNFIDYEHPCEGENWTWFSILDHIQHGGGPLPAPDAIEVYTRVVYNEVVGNLPTRLGNISGITRMGVTLQAFWDGMAHLVDVVLYQHELWGDGHAAPDVVWNQGIPGVFNYVVLDGRYTAPVCAVTRNEDRGVLIPYNRILLDLMARGLLPYPTGPWVVGSVGIFTEVHNLTRIGAAAADLLVKELRVF